MCRVSETARLRKVRTIHMVMFTREEIESMRSRLQENPSVLS